ncbi:hypothetical protein COY26_01205 [Candidatus Woesearchaeota archaeon CG_4_10_14_0_2_um_filter_33_10]|nr:MAG: hypothetical protein COY26_01205 [Candidatus Woesearchaeota archaeon CG_4_10_14_0_2_um_filter_33_10]
MTLFNKLARFACYAGLLSSVYACRGNTKSSSTPLALKEPIETSFGGRNYRLQFDRPSSNYDSSRCYQAVLMKYDGKWVEIGRKLMKDADGDGIDAQLLIATLELEYENEDGEIKRATIYAEEPVIVADGDKVVKPGSLETNPG